MYSEMKVCNTLLIFFCCDKTKSIILKVLPSDSNGLKLLPCYDAYILGLSVVKKKSLFGSFRNIMEANNHIFFIAAYSVR